MSNSKLICGVGTNNYKGRVKIAGKHIPSYTKWRDMLRRVGNDRDYTNSSIDGTWLEFSQFNDWFDRQHYESGWQLDKDILCQGNLIYKEGLCCLVPKEMNITLTNRHNHRGEYPVGVSYRPSKSKSNPFYSRCYYMDSNLVSRRLHLGCYSSPEEAHLMWRKCKAESISNLLEYYSQYKTLIPLVFESFEDRISTLLYTDNQIDIKV